MVESLAQVRFVKQLWSAIVANPLAAVLVIVALIALLYAADRVMTHHYAFAVQWGPDRRMDLAPARP